MSGARRWLRRLAWASVVLSFPVWGAAFVVAPLLPLSAARRALAAGGLLAAGEALFWLPTLVLGAEVVNRFRRPRVRTGRSFAGRRVAVLGATGGLGQAIARALRREGAELTLLGRDTTRLAGLAAELGALAAPLDLLTPGAAEVAARDAESEGLDVLVCATGIDLRKPLGAHSEDELAQEVAIDLLGPMRVARAFLPRLRPGGTLAVLGGFADGRVALPYYAPDVAARAGLAAFCTAVNQELVLADDDRRLVYVCPAPTDTEAERPYGPLWRALGTPLVSADKAADFVLAALLARREQAVMGWSTRLLARISGFWPALGSAIVVRLLGPTLRRHLAQPLG